MSDVSVIGLGSMGSALARTLSATGHRVTVWNRTTSKAEPLLGDGVTLAKDIASAITVSPVSITCVSNHKDVLSMLTASSVNVSGRTLIDLSSGTKDQANTLDEWVEAHGGQCLIGGIQNYPAAIGTDGALILVTGSTVGWSTAESVLRVLAPRTTYLGTQHNMSARLEAALFTSRIGFMFGMVNGAIICEKSGVSTKVFFDTLRATMPLVSEYLETAARTIPSNRFGDSSARLGEYAVYIAKAVDELSAEGIDTSFIASILQPIERAAAAGHADDELTSVIKVLR